MNHFSNILKISLLCGISFTAAEKTMAVQWNNAIDEMTSPTDTRGLRALCHTKLSADKEKTRTKGADLLIKVQNFERRSEPFQTLEDAQKFLRKTKETPLPPILPLPPLASSGTNPSETPRAFPFARPLVPSSFTEYGYTPDNNDYRSDDMSPVAHIVRALGGGRGFGLTTPIPTTTHKHNVREEIDILTVVVAFPEDQRNLSSNRARLQKLKQLNERGILEYSDDVELNAFLPPTSSPSASVLLDPRSSNDLISSHTPMNNIQEGIEILDMLLAEPMAFG